MMVFDIRFVRNEKWGIKMANDNPGTSNWQSIRVIWTQRVRVRVCNFTLSNLRLHNLQNKAFWKYLHPPVSLQNAINTQ
jgi:hypothetical protein